MKVLVTGASGFVGSRAVKGIVDAGQLVPLREVVRIIAETTGRKGPRGTAPSWLVLLTGRIADGLQRLGPAQLPLDYEGPRTALRGIPFDASPTTRELAITLRPASESIADTARWLIDQGLLAVA